MSRDSHDESLMNFFCQRNISDKVTNFEAHFVCRTLDTKAGPHFMSGL